MNNVELPHECNRVKSLRQRKGVYAMYAESADGRTEESGVFDIRSPNFRSSRPRPPRRQFPLRSKIQIDRIMGIREGRRDIDKRRGGRGGMGKRHPSRFPPPRDRDFIPYDSRRRFCRIGIAESDWAGPGVTKYTAACLGSLRCPIFGPGATNKSLSNKCNL